MKIRINRSSVRLLILGAVCIYNTCTYLQIYNSFYISATILGILIVDSIYSLRIDKRFANNLFIWFVISILVLLIIMSLKSNIARLLNDISLVWGVFYSVIIVRDILENYQQKQIERFLSIQTLILMLSLVTTLYFLKQNPLAARAVGGVGSGDSSESLLKAQGCGGYGFVYGSVAVAYAYMVRIKNRAGNNASNVVFLVMFSYLVISANYTTAILLLLILYVYVFAIPENSKYTYVLYFTIIVILVFFSDVIIEQLHTISQHMGMTIVSDKLLSLMKASTITGYYQTMSRYNVFMISIESFLSNPLIGGTVTSGHSVLLDLLADIGIFSIIVVFCLTKQINSYILYLSRKSVLGILTIFFIISTLDTFFHPAQIIMTFIFAPLLMVSQPHSSSPQYQQKANIN